MEINKKANNKVKRLVRNEFNSNIQTYIICGVVLVVLGIFSFLCTLNISARNHYIIYLVITSVASVVAGLGILVGGIYHSISKRELLKKHIDEFSFGVEASVKSALLGFPDPIVIVETDGTIQWYNQEFADICEPDELHGINIQEIFPSIRIVDFIDDDSVTKPFSYNGRDFMLMGKKTSTEYESVEYELISISFADISDVTRLRNQLDEKQTVVCTAIIDNYDEVLRETPTSNHGVLIGDVERCIGLWVERGDGFYRRYERDKFIILFESAKFNLLLAEKFSVLNEIKEIDQQNKIPVTLSIGVGIDAEDIKENDRMSLSALEMALGRGGDQAVVKSADGYSFYGAKSLGVEKTTKVKARVVAKNLCNMIDKASNVIIMGHKGCDFDSFGTSVGLFRAVVNRGKKANIALDRNHNNVGAILKEALIHSEYNEGIVSFDKAVALLGMNTLLIVVDTHRASMVEYPELLEKAKNVVLIDHHRRSEDFIENTALTYHEPYASSASEMVAEVFQYMDDEKGLSLLEAEALYCGIYLDTKGFTFKTGARTFEAAAFLRKMGVDPVRVHKLFRNDISTYIQKSNIIGNTKIYRGNIAMAVCDTVSKNLQLVVAQAADDLLDISNVEASFVLALVGNKVIISGRSLGSINVQVVLEKLGGGGHSTIAGAQLENTSISMAELKLKNAIDEVLFD